MNRSKILTNLKASVLIHFGLIKLTIHKGIEYKINNLRMFEGMI